MIQSILENVTAGKRVGICQVPRSNIAEQSVAVAVSSNQRGNRIAIAVLLSIQSIEAAVLRSSGQVAISRLGDLGMVLGRADSDTLPDIEVVGISGLRDADAVPVGTLHDRGRVKVTVIVTALTYGQSMGIGPRTILVALNACASNQVTDTRLDEVDRAVVCACAPILDGRVRLAVVVTLDAYGTHFIAMTVSGVSALEDVDDVTAPLHQKTVNNRVVVTPTRYDGLVRVSILLNIIDTVTNRAKIVYRLEPVVIPRLLKFYNVVVSAVRIATIRITEIVAIAALLDWRTRRADVVVAGSERLVNISVITGTVLNQIEAVASACPGGAQHQADGRCCRECQFDLHVCFPEF